MWCRTCQQDVPGLISADAAKYSCPRCGTALGSSPAAPTPESPADAAAIPPGEFREVEPGVGAEPPAPYDRWELEEKLRHIERMLRIDEPDTSRRPAEAGQRVARIDAAHAQPPGWHQPQAARAKAARRRARSRGLWLPMLTWTVLATGLMASAFGGVLLAWAALGGRQDLWAIGLPVGLGGQIVLVIGLILQLDRLWHDSRNTVDKLDHVDQRLHHLNKTATLLGTGAGSASASFYSHMAGGASPQLLLADLKSQLDLLSLRLGQENG